MIMDNLECGNWKGIKVWNNCPPISHMMFFDDLLIFGEAKSRQMECVKKVLEIFYNISCQGVSNEKTIMLFSNNTSKHTRQKLIRMLGYKETNKLGKYLGMPITRRSLKSRDFNHILENIKNKLTSWKSSHLSFVRRVTLAKTVVEYIPTYSMMTCSLSLRSASRNFLAIFNTYDQHICFHHIYQPVPHISCKVTFKENMAR